MACCENNPKGSITEGPRCSASATDSHVPWEATTSYEQGLESRLCVIPMLGGQALSTHPLVLRGRSFSPNPSYWGLGFGTRMALSFCSSLRGTGRPGSVEQWRCHCPGCIRSDAGPYLPPVSSFSSEVLLACSPASQLWRVSAPSSYPASGSVRLAPPAVGSAHWHRLRLRPAPGGRRTGWAAPLHHLGSRMAAGSQRPLSLGRRGAW